MMGLLKRLSFGIGSTVLMLGTSQLSASAVSLTADIINIPGESGLQIIRESADFGGEEWIKASFLDADPDPLTQERIDAGFRLATRTDVEGLLNAYLMTVGAISLSDDGITPLTEFGVSPSFTSFFGTTAGTVLNGIYLDDNGEYDFLTVTNDDPIGTLPANAWRVRPTRASSQSEAINNNRAFLLVRDVPEPTVLAGLLTIGGLSLATKRKKESA